MSTAPDSIEALELLSPVQKALHFAQPNPWAGLKMRGGQPMQRHHVSLDASGNTVRQPILIGRPCFGQISAFARFGDLAPMRGRGGRWFSSRCERCPANEACAKVCQARIKAVPEIEQAWHRFVSKGGPQGLRQPSMFPGAEQAFKNLVAALVRHGGFSSINDVAVREHYNRERLRKRADDAKRKREDRRKKIAAGLWDDAFEDVLRRQRTWRLMLLRQVHDLAMRPSLPMSLRNMPEASCEVTCDAWLAREVLRLRQQPVNPSAIAGEMRRRNPQRYPNHNSLRQRVRADLDRVDLLERFVVPGKTAPVWKRFDLTEVLAEEENDPLQESGG